MASSNVFEHSRPMLNTIVLDTLPILRLHITGGIEDWQLMPTSASFSRPFSRASSIASVLAEYV
jgi:hypothetical protein